MVSKRALIITVIIIVAGVAFMRNAGKTEVNLTFTEANMNSLESKINSLSFDDLEGLSSTNTTLFKFTSQDIDILGQKIEGLSFDDLEGLNSP